MRIREAAALVALGAACFALGLWTGGGALPEAAAQQQPLPFPSAAEQRQLIIEQLERLNEQIEFQNELLESGVLRIEPPPAE